MSLARLASVLAFAALSAACAAVYPEVDTRLSVVADRQRVAPGPPEGLRWVRVVSAHVPAETRDGRPWKTAFGKLPDPYAKVFVDDKEILRTPIEGGTLEPTWPKAPRGNFALVVGDKLRVELWDANPLHDAPIGMRDSGAITDQELGDQHVDLELDGGARMVVAIEPAHPMYGLGLRYEMRTTSIFVTRALEFGPAARAGLHPGDEIAVIGGRDVSAMQPDEARSHLAAPPFEGLKLVVKKPDGTRADVVLKEGACYPRFDQYGAVD